MLEIADDGRGIDAERGRGARARDSGSTVPDGPLDCAALLGSALRARVLDARRSRSGERPRRRHGGREDDRAGARRHADARDRAGRGHAVRHRAAADAGDHRRADRARRRPDVRGAAGRGPRGDRGRALGAARRSRTTRSCRIAAACCRSSGSRRLFGIAEQPRRALHVVRRRDRADAGRAWPSIASSASARSSCARWPTR